MGMGMGKGSERIPFLYFILVIRMRYLIVQNNANIMNLDHEHKYDDEDAWPASDRNKQIER